MFNLRERERKLLNILYVILGALAVFFLIIKPFISYRKNIRDEFNSNFSKLETLDRIYSEFRGIKEKKSHLDDLLRDNRGISTLIEENAKKANILTNKVYTRDNTSNIQNRYQKTTTSVKFEGVDIRSIVNFLYEMEFSGKYVEVSYLRIYQAIKERNTYDVTIKFDTYKID